MIITERKPKGKALIHITYAPHYFMNAQEFTNLYTKQDSDETITTFQNETGFSLIRTYPKDTLYHKDNLRMFMNIGFTEKGLFYGVDMTKPELRGEKKEYIIIDDEKYKRKVTNFLSDSRNPEFIFDSVTGKISHIKTKKILMLNDFVEILFANHLSDRLYWKRKIGVLVNIILKGFFWLSDKHYEKVRVSLDIYHYDRENKPLPKTQDNIEPFFKYFYISKNLIFTMLVATFLIAISASVFPCKFPLKSLWTSLFGDFLLSNPIVVLLFFLGLFSFEKLSVYLNTKINDFLKPEKQVFSKRKENFIEKLHNYQYKNSFDLKL